MRYCKLWTSLLTILLRAGSITTLTGLVLDNGHCAISSVLPQLEILLKAARFRSRAKLTRCSNAQESDHLPKIFNRGIEYQPLGKRKVSGGV